MGWAAGDGAAGGQAALAAECKTDPGTLARVAEVLRGQLGGRMLPPAAPFIGPGEELQRRTGTPRGPLDGGRRR
jgi:hypothetical protein